MKVLIIEDSSAKYEKVKKFLDKNNIQSDRASSYETGIKLLTKNQYDGLFLDMQFPRTDCSMVSDRHQGTNVLAEMKKRNIDIPVCVHSSFKHLDFRGDYLVRKYIRYEVGINLEEEYEDFINEIKQWK